MIAALLCASCTGPGQASRVTRSPVGPELDRIESIVQRSARRHGVDPALVRGVIHVESRFRVDARSSVGARGLMQLMPNTARHLARELGLSSYDIEDPAFNVDAGAYYLARLLARFRGDTALALAAYHTGPSRIARLVARGTSLPGYSRRYVRDVLAAAERLRHAAPRDLVPHELDQDGLRELLQLKLYGPREDVKPVASR